MRWFRKRRKGNRELIEIDFPPRPRSRAPNEHLARIVAAGSERYASMLRSMLDLANDLARIPELATTPRDPFWSNKWIPAMDGVSLYGFTALRKPRRYVEVGSGNSTKFVRRAATDHTSQTLITSIDPQPRAEIDQLCDKIVRSRLEEADQSIFDGLTAGDIVFCDGSHRAFQNSDATVFMTEIVPRLPPGVLIGIHDVFLPWDYPHEWAGRYYSEQYLLACYLLGGAAQIELPIAFCSRTPELARILDPLWQKPNLERASRDGGILWFTHPLRA